MSNTDNIGQEAARINAAFDKTGVTFHDRAEALAVFKEGRAIVTSEDDGELYAVYDSETLPLDQALLRFAYDQRQQVDGRTLPRSGAGTARPGILSKADFPDVKSKVEFIREHGEEAYARLPLTGAGTSETLTKSDWYKLPRSEKIRRLAADSEAFNRLPAGDPTIKGALVNRSYTNREALAKIKAIRPSSKR